MRFVHREAGVEREFEARLGRPDAVVADLAAALGIAGGRLAIDGRETPPGSPLAGSGLVMGSEVTAVTRTASSATRLMHTGAADRGAVLRIIGGLDAGESVPLRPGRVRLGRGDEADIRVTCNDVSRLHCEIEVTDDGQVTVTDLGSSNGTDLNGARLTAPTRVGPDDVVCAAGRVPFRILPADALGPVQYGNPAQEAGPGGTLPFNRAPRVAAPAAAPPVRVPEPPRRTEGQPLRITALVLPLLLAGVMVLVLKDAAYALIALFSPLIMLGTMLEERGRGRSSRRRGKREYAARLAAACDQLAERRARSGSPGCTRISRTRQSSATGRRRPGCGCGSGGAARRISCGSAQGSPTSAGRRRWTVAAAPIRNLTQRSSKRSRLRSG